MSKQEGRVKTEELVKGYFEYVKKLRSGEKGSVEKLLEMWDEDGVFEFVGSPPVTEYSKGRMLYMHFTRTVFILVEWN